MLSHTSHLSLFLTAALLVCVAPGPDMLYVIANSIQGGTRAGLIASVGMAAGMLFHTLAVSTGLALLLVSSSRLFLTLQLAGALYLLWIGYQSLRDARQPLVVQRAAGLLLAQVFRRAFVTNVLNPKVIVFFVAFLPQFVDRHATSAGYEMFALGFIFLVMGLIVDSVVGSLSGRARATLLTKAWVPRTLNVAAGLVFCGLGILQLVSAARS